MMKFGILFLALFVSTHAKPMFPYLGGYRPNNLDQDDGVVQGNQQNAGQNAAEQGVNEPGDTPDDDEAVAPIGPGGQAGTTLAPASPGDSSSSSSEETGSEGGAGGGAGTTAAAGGPIVGAEGAGQAGQAGQAAGGTGGAGGDSGDVVNAAGGPMVQPQANPGQSSNGNAVDPAGSNPLNRPQAIKQQKARRSGAAVALTTMLLVAGVASVSIVVYKYKDAIRARMGL